MTWRWSLGILIAALACSSGTETGNPKHTVGCSVDRDCQAAAQQSAATLSQPTNAPVLSVSSCEAPLTSDGGPGSESTCLCGDGGKPVIAVSTSMTACAVVGRARDCLYDASKFTGCDPSQPSTSCSAVCSEIQALLDADAARALTVSVHSAVCEAEQCRSILSIDGRCFVDASTLAHDCSLSASEILSREAQGIP